MSSVRRRSAPSRLLAWYEQHRRPLPWRRDRDPYRVWVSEIMLQQTRVEAAIPYYERFLERFPDLASLAAADEERVLAAWSGLGYYRRARQLHAAARELVAAGREWPRDAAGWRRLPGVGPYTAAAVASICFDERQPALDGNVLRVVGRLTGERRRPDRAAVRRRLERRARELLDPRRPGDSNQALMELGATLCRPLRPRCSRCPLRSGCRAAASGEPESFPGRRPALPSRRQRRVVAVVRRRGRLLLFRRAADRRQLAGFWELPWVEGAPGTAAERELSRRYGGRWRLGEPLARVRHAITTRRIEAELWSAGIAGGEIAEGAAAAGWYAPAELAELPTGSLVRKLLAAAAGTRAGVV